MWSRIKNLPPYRHVKWDPAPAELRKWGFVMLAGLILFSAIAAWREGGFGILSFSLSAAGLICFAAGFAPAVGLRLYRLVYLLTSPIGYVVSHLLLTAIFFLLFLPLGLVLRAQGRDLLRLKPSPEAGSWIRRSGPRPARDYYRQY